MHFHQLNEGSCKTYLVASSREAILVDPLLGREDHYLAELRARRLALRAILDTHTHADHLSACALLRDRTGADHVVHKASRAREGNLRVTEGQRITLGDTVLEILHTPGHTADSLSLIGPGHLLTGDCLWLGEDGAGRTDLPGGDPGIHWDSLQKLGALDGGLCVLPGHDYRNAGPSTLANERQRNPRLQPHSREAYVTWLQSLQLPPAEWMVGVVNANLACIRTATGIHIPQAGASDETASSAESDVPLMACETLAAMSHFPFLLDVRNPDEWNGPLGHIAGAHLLPLPQLSDRIEDLAYLRNQSIVTICKAGGRSSMAAKLLLNAGFKDVRSLAGGMCAWNSPALASPILEQPARPEPARRTEERTGLSAPASM